MIHEYGIVANVAHPDKCLKMGSKSWIINGTGGTGLERFEFLGRTRGGRLVRKWCTTKRFNNFRVAFIPEYVRDMANGAIYFSGPKEQCESYAKMLNEFVGGTV